MVWLGGNVGLILEGRRCVLLREFGFGRPGFHDHIINRIFGEDVLVVAGSNGVVGGFFFLFLKEGNIEDQEKHEDAQGETQEDHPSSE